MGGAFLSLSATGVFLDNMTRRGHIALAILIEGAANRSASWARRCCSGRPMRFSFAHNYCRSAYRSSSC